MSTTEQRATRPRWHRLGKRALEWLALGFAGLLFFMVSALLLTRLVFNDDRLARMGQELLTERTGAEAEITGLQLSLCTGLELGPSRIGPLPGFVHDTVAFDRMAVRWSTFDLLFLDLVIPEVALEGLEVTLEENESGRNLDALIFAFAGPFEPEEPEPEEPEPKEPFRPLRPLSLPVSVRLERLAISIDSARVHHPDLDLQMDRVGLSGRLEGEGTTINLELWAGLGDREPEGTPSVLTLQGEDLLGDIRIEQRLGIAVAATGLEDIRIELDWIADGTISGDEPFPPVRANAKIDASADLLAQTAELSQLVVGIGASTRLELAARGREILTNPVANVETLELSSDLGELAPLAAPFVEGVTAAGELHLSAEPFELAADPDALMGTRANLALLLSEVDMVLGDIAGGVRAGSVEVGVQLVTENGRADVQVDAQVPRARAAGQTVRDLDLRLTAATPMAPWLNGVPEGKVEARLEVVAREAGGAAGRGIGVDLTASALAPIEFLRHPQAAEPAQARLRLTADRLEVPGTQIHGIRLQLDARAWEMAGERFEASLDTRAATVVATPDQERLMVSNTHLQLEASRHDQRFDVRRLFLSTADTLELELQGVVNGALSARPRFNDVGIRLSLLDLEQLLSLVPPSQRPDLVARGSAEVRFTLDGTLAYRELLRQTRPPKVESDDMGIQVQAYVDYVERWEEAFRRGMPVVTNLDLSLLDLELESVAAHLGGVALDLGLAIERHGPRTNLVIVADRIERPVGLTNLRTDVELSFQDGFFNVGLSGTVGRFDADNMARPIRDVTADLSLRYRLGGDLLLDELRFAAPEPGVSLDASGVLSKPLRFLLARGWERPDLPGLSAALRWHAGIELGDELRPLRAGGPELAGGLSLAGNLRAEEGAVSFDGILEVSDFHFRDPEQGTRLEQLAGGLPVEVEVAFDPRDDAAILRRGLNLGSGLLAVVASAEDIRKRPARPAYYERLRPYRQQRGLTFRSFRSGNLDIEDFELSGRITDGMLLVDRLAMHVLGGDVDGSLALQLGRDASLRTELAVKVSNIDASYFKALNVEPGPSSELSADMQLGFLAAPHGRNLTFDMNITKMSTDTLDRFLLLLDGGAENGPNSGTRGLLGLVHLEGVKAWIRYENLNMDLDAAPILRIPGTTLGYPNIPPDIVRLQNLTVFLDEYAQPQIDNAVAPLLGWKRDDEN